MYGIRKTHLTRYKSKVHSNLNCWKSRNTLVKFSLKWNKALVAYLEGGGGEGGGGEGGEGGKGGGGDDDDGHDNDDDDDVDDDKRMRTALS